ncbi:Hsp70 protein-domain-containing protein [Mycena capillaripes]|nr:Hsp70 protein-domain-containing protein [Mycena capillaripes]
MPADSKWLGDVLAGVAFFLGLTCYAIRMIPPTFPREPPETPVKWDKAGPIIGIDLGTTYARVGLVVSEHRVQIFRDHDSLPAGYFNNAASPASSACQFKYLPLSTNFEVNVVTDYLVGPEDSPARRLALPATFTSYSEDCSSLHKMAASLHKLRVTAENFYGSAISQAVIAIPNAYTEDQRGTIKDMAVLAGLSPVRLIDQSVVIAMAYGLDRRRGESYALVLDVGSTARATLLHVDNGDLRVLSHSQNLGGSAFNQLLFDYAMDAHGDKMNENLTTVQKLILEDQVEMAKIKLSVEDYAAIALPMEDPPWFIVSLAAAEFNKIVESLVEDIVAGTTNEVLSTVQVSPNAVDHVILAGGSAYIPALKDRFARQFPSTVPLSTGESYPDDAVVYGASLFARRLALDKVPDDSKIYVQNATPMRFGVEVVGGLFATVIPRNSPLPATFTRRLDMRRNSFRHAHGSLW